MTAHRRSTCERGQTTVELALVLPLVVLLMLVVGQVGVVARAHVVVAHAAREGARAAAVGADPAAAALAGGRLDPARTSIRVDGGADPGDLVTVTVEYSAPTDLPIIGEAVPDIVLRASVTMRREG